MRRGAVLLVGLLIAVIALAAFPAQAGYCYRLRVLSKGTEILDEWLGVGCSKSGQAVSVTTERIGHTLVETSRYAGR